MKRTTFPRIAFGIAVATAFMGAPPRAAAKSDSLDQGRKMFEELEYEKAIPLLVKAATDPLAAKTEVVEAYTLLGYATVAAGRETEALEAFIKLLKIDRSFKLKPRTSPKIRAIFDRARSLVPDNAPAPSAPLVNHVHVPTARPGEPIHLSVTIVEPTRRVRSVTLRHRAGVGAFISSPMRETGIGRFSLSVAPVPGRDAIEYYFLARDERGIIIAALRDEESPFRVVTRTTVRVSKAESPLWKKWWFWAAMGGAAALSATIAVVTSGAGSTTPDYGNVRLIVK